MTGTMTNTPNSRKIITNPLGNMYSTDEVAKMLNVSRRTVQRMIQKGELIAIGKKRHYRIPEEELKKWKERELTDARLRAEEARKNEDLETEN
jgi:excisionase family DNA binding protein